MMLAGSLAPGARATSASIRPLARLSIAPLRPAVLANRRPIPRRAPVRVVGQAVASDASTGGTPAVAGARRSTQKSSALNSSGQAPSGAGLYDAPLAGYNAPMGASLVKEAPGTVNFAVHASGASGVSLCLFTEADLKAGKVTEEIELCPELNRTKSVWHIRLANISPELLYAYRVAGPSHIHHDDGFEGHSHDATRVVVDPYATSVVSRSEYGVPAADLGWADPEAEAAEATPGVAPVAPVPAKEPVLGYGPCWPQAAGALPAADDFDWEGDTPINRPLDELVIYEAHVRGFTRHESSGSSAPGTYRGLIDRLDHLQNMGINALELLPVNEFNELEYYGPNPASPGEYRFNYWGYSTVAFMAPMARFSHDVITNKEGPGKAHAATREFKELVKACHKRGIEVILDVVFNHTAEGNHMGPHLSFRGLDNQVYYMLAPGGEYYNYSGCGNTFNCNHPVVRDFIVDCLVYWVEEMHVDGFRFDLASILTRTPSIWSEEVVGHDGAVHTKTGIAYDDEGGKFMTDGNGVITGTPLAEPAVVEMISNHPKLKNTKLIAEAWDCEGLNQVGAFPHYGKWAEWNGSFRDNVRNFLKGTEGAAGMFSAALLASPQVYKDHQAPEDSWWGNNTGKQWRGDRPPFHSVNFITAHDGFTLRDLVSYNDKHNDANNENNNDGEEHNLSWNCGAEGDEGADRGVKRLRGRQMKNFMAALLCAQGVPMLHMGDEYGHTKGGNNNTYCHDNALNWFDWKALEDNQDLCRFVRNMITLRATRPHLRSKEFLGGDLVQWHGHEPHQPDWSDGSRLVAFTLSDKAGGGLYVAFNASHLAATVALPKFGDDKPWQLLVDTSKPSPLDCLLDDGSVPESVLEVGREQSRVWLEEGLYPMVPRSCVILECKAPPPPPVSPAAAAAASATVAAAAAPSAAAAAAVPGAVPATPAPAAAPAAAAAEETADMEIEELLAASGLADEELAELRAMLEENKRLKDELGL